MLTVNILVEPKRPPGRPRGRKFSETLPLRLTPDLSAMIDEWLALQPEPKPSRSEAIRRLVEEALKAKRS